jgi:predicted dienelactone hydrolase
LVKSTKNFSRKFLRRKHRPLILVFLSVILITAPIRAAEEIFFIYGPFSRSLQVSSLEAFAKEGIVDRNLRQYLQATTPQQQAEFRQALTQKTEVNPVLLSRFFHTDIGEDILERLGALITTQGNSNGKFALRSALITSALEPEGLTLLNFLQNLPINMQIDVQKMSRLTTAIDLVIRATNVFTEEVAELSRQEAKRAGEINFAALTDPRQVGSYGVEQRKIELIDPGRQRQFYALLFQPVGRRGTKTPVIIFSHGLAARPEDYARQAQHWASYGYLVVLPQHPGSDTIQVQNLIDGFSRQVFDTDEFIDRPLDIRYVIDELERRNAREFEGRLDLENVGVGGHSFGGYAALAVAGAKIDFLNLEQDCQRGLVYLNISLLLQCRALTLPREDYDFRDPRVKAVFVVNPVNNSIFGQRGLEKIKIPVFLAAGTYDPATPAIFEQVRSFPWLTTVDKYLTMIEGQAHIDFSGLDAGISQTIESVANLTLPSPYLVDEYANALSLAFFEVYTAKNTKYRPFLESAYSLYLSEGQPFKCYSITRASSKSLARSIENFINQSVP